MRVLNVNDVVGITGLSKVTIWRKEKSGNFPKRINLTSRRVGWIESEIVGWLEDRPRGICAEQACLPERQGANRRQEFRLRLVQGTCPLGAHGFRDKMRHRAGFRRHLL